MRAIRRHAIAIVLALGGLSVAALLYPKLPARVPIHWGANGAPDNWMPREVGAFLQPITYLAMVGLLMACEPAKWREAGAGPMHWAYPAMVATLSGFMLYVTLLMLLAGMGARPDMLIDVTAGIGVLFAALGNTLGKVPRNRVVGIRQPWTLSNPEVWSRTHRLAGWLYTLAGAATTAFALLSRSPSSPIFGGVALIAAALVANVYSFVLARRLRRGRAAG